jgi:hypothetical protein
LRLSYTARVERFLIFSYLFASLCLHISRKISQSSRRVRRKTSRFEFDALDNEEQKLIQQALRNSKRETKRVDVTVPEAPIYHPTAEEFKRPLDYIMK